jgi:poly(ADP-ribose) glycohydrolase
MFIHFFERLAMLPPDRRELSGHLCFRRLAAPQAALSMSFWQECNLPLKELTVLNEGLIEDDCNDIQVDFANEMIGGGVICGGCVQEEIRFVRGQRVWL